MPDSAPPLSEPAPSTSAARQRILLAAHDLFYRDGIRATGVDRVIAESGVTKVTFYRHFPSKNDLILAFLAYRHTRWMAWFDDALTRHGHTAEALVPTFREWAGDPGYRGCAFINSVGEMAQALPEVVALSRQHKQDMVARIATLLPPGPEREADAQALGMALDGAILRAQFDQHPDAAVATLQHLVAKLDARVSG
jgi:AcrR family transcriptional regulator